MGKFLEQSYLYPLGLGSGGDTGVLGGVPCYPREELLGIKPWKKDDSITDFPLILAAILGEKEDLLSFC